MHNMSSLSGCSGAEKGFGTEIRRSGQPHQLVSFVLVEKQRLFQRPSDVGVGRDTLEVGGRKLGEFVLGQVLVFLVR